MDWRCRINWHSWRFVRWTERVYMYHFGMDKHGYAIVRCQRCGKEREQWEQV